VRARAVANPAGARDLAVLNSVPWRAATVPAVNLHATAMLIARFYRVLLDGDLPSPAIAPFEGVDRFIGSNTVWGLGVRFEPDGTWGMGGLGGNAGRPYTGRRSRT